MYTCICLQSITRMKSNTGKNCTVPRSAVLDGQASTTPADWRSASPGWSPIKGPMHSKRAPDDLCWSACQVHHEGGCVVLVMTHHGTPLPPRRTAGRMLLCTSSKAQHASCAARTASWYFAVLKAGGKRGCSCCCHCWLRCTAVVGRSCAPQELDCLDYCS